MFNIKEPWSAARWQEGFLASIKENLSTCPQHSENFLKPHYAFKREFIFFGGGSKITADDDCSHEIKRCVLPGRKVMTNLDSILKSRDITLPTKVCLSSQGYGFSSSCVWMWELDYKEGWVPKNWCFWTVVLEKTLENSLDCKEIQPVHEGDQSWVFIGRTDAEAEVPILWPHDAKNWLIWKDPDAGKDWRWEEKGMTEDELVGWHHRRNGHESE